LFENLLIFATGTAQSGSKSGSMLLTIGYIVLLAAMFYFLLIRPQRKQRKEKENMMSNLSVGDEIYTIGGILGTVTRIKDRTVWLRVSEKTEIELLKSSIGGVSRSVNGGYNAAAPSNAPQPKEAPAEAKAEEKIEEKED